MNKPMPIYSYFELGCADINVYHQIWRWRDAWAAVGLEPRVLNYHHARSHPGYPLYRDLPHAFPFVAVSYVTGKTFCAFTTYNVFPKPFHHIELVETAPRKVKGSKDLDWPLTVYGEDPNLVFLTGTGYAFTQAIERTKKGITMPADMLVLDKPEPIQVRWPAEVKI